MTNNISLHRYFYFILLFLAACGPQTVTLPTETVIPTVVSSTPLPPTTFPTSTAVPVTVSPSPLPTMPLFPVITPGPIQLERWNEYEEALAKAFFKGYFRPEEVVCEWVILGQAIQEVYVWGYCSGIYSAGPSGGSIPAVIHLRANGSVESAEIPGSGSRYGEDIRRMFPPHLQARIFDHAVPLQELDDRLRWRRGHPQEPPLVILNSLSIQPTPAIIPWITPNPIQVETWMEYQSALAEQLSYLPPDQMLCEWEVLGRSGMEVYVWAICGEIWGGTVGLEGLLKIELTVDGSVQTVIPSGTGGEGFPSQIRRMFPTDVLERYFQGEIHFEELVDHLRWRQTQGHQGEPPLIVVKSTSSQ